MFVDTLRDKYPGTHDNPYPFVPPHFKYAAPASADANQFPPPACAHPWP